MSLSTRNPMKDQVVIVGVGSSPYGRDLGRSRLSLGLEAAVKAIEDAGIDKQQIDGICGNSMGMLAVGDAGCLSLQGALGIERITWMINSTQGAALAHPAYAVAAGACDYALVVQVLVRGPGMSSSAANDPLRMRMAMSEGGGGFGRGHVEQRWTHSAEPYAAWAGRYLATYNAPRDVFGMVAINNRSWAAKNPEAILKTPINMETYLNSRMIREPLAVLDMDLPCDCAEALVITTAEHARDLKQKPVYIHAMTLGGTRVGEYYENGLAWNKTCPWVAMEALWPKSDLKREDMDLFFPYDGFSPITVSFTEAAGYCGVGECWDLFQDCWDAEAGILRLNGGKTVLTTNGGGMSHGRNGGFNFYAEAVRQLRGQAGERQVPNAKYALMGIGSFYHDPVAAVLRAD